MAFTEKINAVALILKSESGYMRFVFNDPYHANGWSRKNRPFVTRLVVETYISAGYGSFELCTGFAHAFYGSHKLPVNFGVIWITKVEAVRHRQRPSTGDSDIAVRLGEGQPGSLVRVQAREATVAVGRQRHPQPGLLVELDEQTALFFRRNLGIKPLERDVGIEAFMLGLGDEVPQLAVLQGVRDKIERAWGIGEAAASEPLAASSTAAAPSVNGVLLPAVIVPSSPPETMERPSKGRAPRSCAGRSGGAAEAVVHGQTGLVIDAYVRVSLLGIDYAKLSDTAGHA